MTKDIFSEDNAVQVGFFKFEKIGDKIFGTYIEKINMPGKGIYQPQIGYKLKTDNGVVVVALGEKKSFVHDSMKSAKLGQVVGFKYTGDFETEASKKDKNISPAKTIKVYLGEMDKAYVAKEELGGEEINTDEVPFN